MNSYIKIGTLFSILTVASTQAQQINYLNVEGSDVYFSTTTSKAASAPSCAAAATNEQYAISLNTESGKAIYSLLITAMASKQGVNVLSANDCADVTGVERAKGVSMVPVTVHDSAKGVYLYTGDGITKLGPIISSTSTSGYGVTYLANQSDRKLSVYNHPGVSGTLYFTTHDCSGTAYSSNRNRVFYNPGLESGRYMTTYGSKRVAVERPSQLSNNGTCTQNTMSSTTLYEVKPYNDPICGDFPCTIKEE